MDYELTNLPSRHRFIEWLKQAHCARQNHDRQPALLVIRIHNLRAVNDEIGIVAGDALLVELTRRIKLVLRDQDQLARVSSSQFGVILPSIHTEGLAVLAATKIARQSALPFRTDGVDLKPRVTVGIAMVQGSMDCSGRLLNDCEHAARIAATRAEGYALVDQATSDTDRSHTLLESDLEKAIESNEISVCYQPKIDIKRNCVAGVELLCRWECPQRGWIDPEIFVDVAEHSGLILPLTIRTLHTALRELQPFFQKFKHFSLALNLSPVLLDNSEITELITNALKVWDTDPTKLTIEVTENAVMKDPDICLAALADFHEQSISVSLDDFGTGHSSLSYLSVMPLSELKIDKSFVQRMHEKAGDLKLVEAIIGLGHKFGLTIVAEGVENAKAAATLKSMECDFAQGYFYGKAMNINDLLHWVEWNNMQGRSKDAA